MGEGTGEREGDELADGFLLLVRLLALVLLPLEEVLERLLLFLLCLLLVTEEVLLDWVIDSSSSASAAFTCLKLVES